jgi:hypothetical protein
VTRRAPVTRIVRKIFCVSVVQRMFADVEETPME